MAAAPATTTHTADAAGIIREAPILPAFDVELSASGSMKPGTPIQVHLRVEANLPIEDAEIVVATPDLAHGVAPTLNRRFPASPNRDAPRRLSRRASWAKGNGLNETVSLTIPAPGYYRVTASAFARSELPAFVEGERVVGAVHREIWLRVDKRGGRYTAQFDTAAFPAQAERRAGALHCVVDLDEERRGRRRDPGCDGAVVTMYDPSRTTSGPVAMAVGDEVCIMDFSSDCETVDPCLLDPLACEPTVPYTPPAPADPCYAGTHLCIEFVYYDRNVEQWVPAPEGALVEGSYQDRDCFVACWWTEETSTFVRTNNLGRVTLRCPSSSTEKRLRTAYEFLDEYTAVSRSEWDGPTVRGACPTGWHSVEMVPNAEAYVFGNMRTSARRAHQVFGKGSPRVRVDFDSGLYQEAGQLGSWYDAPAHTISINDNDIWGYQREGAGVHAHEYGHSYHNMALGGIGHIYISSVDPSHTFDGTSNGAKALLEGFATFFESLVMPGSRSIHRGVRWPQHYGGLPFGPASEAAVSAYLWDVIDDGGEKSAGERADPAWNTMRDYSYPVEAFDQVQISPYTLGRVIDTCGSPSWGLLDSRPESIEGIHRCVKAYDATTTAMGPALDRLYSANINGVFQ